MEDIKSNLKLRYLLELELEPHIEHQTVCALLLSNDCIKYVSILFN